MFVAGCEVGAPAEEADHGEGDAVGEVFWGAVGEVDVCFHVVGFVAGRGLALSCWKWEGRGCTLDGAMLRRFFGSGGHVRVRGSSLGDWFLGWRRIVDGIEFVDWLDGDQCKRSGHRSERSWLQLSRDVLLSAL